MLFSALLACGPDPSPERWGGEPDRPPNVLVVLLDDVGTDKVSAYGEHPRPASTPTLDGLAADGVLFRNAWAMPSCSPTRAALLTGRYPRRTGVGRTVQSRMGDFELHLHEVTLPELLRGAPDAWATSEVGKWHLATYASPDNVTAPAAQGFDWYRSTVSNLVESSEPGVVDTYYDWEKVDNGELVRMSDYVTTDQVDDAIARVRAMPEPWLLYSRSTRRTSRGPSRRPGSPARTTIWTATRACTTRRSRRRTPSSGGCSRRSTSIAPW
jgi:arylsulfatase A-like enzyme